MLLSGAEYQLLLYLMQNKGKTVTRERILEQVFAMLNEICGEIAEQEPDAVRTISVALKKYTGENPDGGANEEMLSSLGYRSADFLGSAYRQSVGWRRWDS